MKSFREYLELTEGVNDPGIFKAIFVVGPSGSGKSFIVGKTGLSSFGLKVSNMDHAFELAMKKAGMEMTADNVMSDKGSELALKSFALTNDRLDLWIIQRLGLVIDGTGKNVDRMKKQKDMLEELGYETAMIYINTDLPTSLARNRGRERSLDDDRIKDIWKRVQANINKYQKMFPRNFHVVYNNDNANIDRETLRVYKNIGKWIKKPPRNRIAKDWIRQNRP